MAVSEGRTRTRPAAQHSPEARRSTTTDSGATKPTTASKALVKVSHQVGRQQEDVPPPRRLSDVDEWGRSERMRSLIRSAYDPLYRHWFRAEWEHFDRIPTQGGALLVANHAGAIPSDAPVIMHGIERDLGRPVYGLADNFFRTVPVVGTLWSRLGGLPANPANAERLLGEQGQLVLVFPEGVKGTGKLERDKYHLARFGRGGFVEIAMRAGVPIVPIAVVGSEEAMPIVWKAPSAISRALGVPYLPLTRNMLTMGPAGAFIPFPAKFRLQVLDPIHFDVPSGQARYSRSRIMSEAEKIRTVLQNAVTSMVAKRVNWWQG